MVTRMDEDDDLLPDREAALDFYVQYEPMEVLGHGLSSVVRKCLHRESGKYFAVKIIDVSSSSAEGSSELEEVQREIEILRAVGGMEYIVNLVEVFETPSFSFLVFELCEKGELYEYLNSCVRLSEKRVRGYMKQLFEAVLHCNNLGYVHRDIKPENILLSDDLSYVKLTDFGLAQHLKPNQRLYQVCGTPGYLAPEVLRSGMYERGHNLCTGYSFEVDAWACGVVMFTLLVGRPPFWNRNQLKLIRQICDGVHSFAGPEWADITDETKDLINRLLDKNQRTRLTVKEALNHDVFQRSPIWPCLMSVNDDNRIGQEDMDKAVDNDRSSAGVQDEAVPEADDTTVLVSTAAEEVTTQAARFDAARAFKCIMNCVRFLIRLQRIKLTPELLSLSTSRVNPYSIRSYRKKIDRWTFVIYHHWVKKGDVQNRAAMFQHNIRIDRVPEEHGVQPTDAASH